MLKVPAILGYACIIEIVLDPRGKYLLVRHSWIWDENVEEVRGTNGIEDPGFTRVFSAEFDVW